MHTEVIHPLVKHKLALIRDKNTDHKHFRELIGEVTMFLAYEAMRNVKTHPVNIETPLQIAHCDKISEEITVIPILRAGVGMLNAILDMVPSAHVGFVGMYRDHETATPIEYYCKLPEVKENSVAFVLDPMLATGGSSAAAITLLKQKGYKKIIFISIVSCPEGITFVEKEHPDVAIYTASIDEGLNDHKYILPGLGDAGDRIFGTK